MLDYALRGISVMLTVVYLLTSVGACHMRDEEIVHSPVEGIPMESVEQVEPRELSILQSLPEISLELQKAAEQFAGNLESTPKITIQTISNPTDYRTALLSKLLAGESVDLFHLPDVSILKALDSNLEDLSFLLWTESAVIEPLRIGSRIVGIPYGVRGTGFVVNRNIFEAAGVPLGDITDYERWSEAFTELQGKIDSGGLAETFPNLEAVTTLPAQSDDYLTQYTADLMLSGAFTTAEQALLAPSVSLPDSADYEMFLKVLIDCSPFRRNWSGLTEVTPRQMIENGIASERLAAILYDTDVWKRIYAINPDLEGSLSLLPIHFENWEQGAIFVDCPAYWALNASSSGTAKEVAGEFLTWLYRESEGTELLAQRFGTASAYRDTAADTGIALHKQMFSHIEQGLARPPVYGATPDRWSEESYITGLREYLTEYEKEWNDVVKACQEDWGTLRLKG